MDCMLVRPSFGAAALAESPKLRPRDGVATPSRGRRAIVIWIDRRRSSGILDPRRSPEAIRTVERPLRPYAIQDAQMTTDTVTAIRSPSNTQLPDHVVAFEVSKHQLVVH